MGRTPQHNWPIHRRLLIVFVLAAVIPAALLALVGYLDGSMLQIQAQALTQVDNANAAINQGSVALQEMNADLRAHVLAVKAGDVAGDAGLEADIYTLELTFGGDLQHYQQAYLLSSSTSAPDANMVLRQHGYIDLINQQAQRFAQVLDAWNAYHQQQDTVLRALSQGQVPAALAAEQQTNISFTALQSSWESLTQINAAVSRAVGTVLAAEHQTAAVRSILLALGTLLLIALLGTYVAGSITRPLRILAELTRNIARGDMTRRAPTFGRDEIGAVAASMNAMLDSIVSLLRQTQEQRDLLQAQVERLVSQVSGIAEGDLRVHVEVTRDSLGVLAESFNYVIDELGRLVARVQEIARAIQQANEDIWGHSGQLVASARQGLHQLTAAQQQAQQIAEMNRLLISDAQTLIKTAQQMHYEARESHAIIHEAASGMEQTRNHIQIILRQSRELRDQAFVTEGLIRSLGDMMHQANRLALDAAIQAAMTGESGRGFGAVVADIRRVSEGAKERVAEASRLISRIAAGTQEVTGTADEAARKTLVNVTAAQQADDALESLDELAERQATLIEQIQRLSSEQALRISAVSDAIAAIVALIENASLDAANVDRIIAKQANLVEQLRASVDAIKVNEPSPTDRIQRATDIGSEFWPRTSNSASSLPARSWPVGATSGIWLPQSHPGSGLLSQERRWRMLQPATKDPPEPLAPHTPSGER